MKIRSLTYSESSVGILLQGLFSVKQALECFASGELQKTLITGRIAAIPKAHRIKQTMRTDFSSGQSKKDVSVYEYTALMKILDACNDENAVESVPSFTQELFKALVDRLKECEFFSRFHDVSAKLPAKSFMLRKELKKDRPSAEALYISSVYKLVEGMEALFEDDESWKEEFHAEYPGVGPFTLSLISAQKVEVDTYVLACDYPTCLQGMSERLAELIGAQCPLEGFTITFDVAIQMGIVALDFHSLLECINDVFATSFDSVETAKEFAGRGYAYLNMGNCQMSIRGSAKELESGSQYKRKGARVFTGFDDMDTSEPSNQLIPTLVTLYVSPLDEHDYFTAEEELSIRESLRVLRELFAKRLMAPKKLRAHTSDA